MTHFLRLMISSRRWSRVLSSCALGVVALSLSGCDTLISGPTPEAAPPIVKKPEYPVFDPADNVTKGVALPGKYRVVGVPSGDLLTIQGVVMATNGTVQSKQYGVPETVRLAGIVAPAPGQPGWQSTVAKVYEWVGGKDDITLETDAKYPLDLDNHRMVQLYFTPGARPKAGEAPKSAGGAQWNLNRMLIHTGYAVVDLYGATSIDLQKWLNDEEFAKTYVDPKDPTIEVLDPVTQQKVKKPKYKPLGLWRLGITIPQRGTLASMRGLAPMPSTAATTKTAGGKIAVGKTIVGKTIVKTTKTTRTTTSSTRIVPNAATRSSTTTNTTARAAANSANKVEALPTPR